MISRSQKITYVLCLMWLFSLSIYSTVLLGTLAHELVHKENARDIIAIEINYDSTGVAVGSFFPHRHDIAYTKGWIVEMFLWAITMFSVIIVTISKLK